MAGFDCLFYFALQAGVQTVPGLQVALSLQHAFVALHSFFTAAFLFSDFLSAENAVPPISTIVQIPNMIFFIFNN